VKKLLALLALLWLVLLPPLFTQGECTHEFDEEQARIARDTAQLASSRSAVQYWNKRGIVPRLVSVDNCRRAKPRDLQSCGAGPFVQASVPVRNLVCKIYRDNETRVRLFYDEHDRLIRTAVEMKPFYSLPIPGVITIHWAK
jgi:hypothetical protein